MKCDSKRNKNSMEEHSQKPGENRAKTWLNLSKVFLYFAKAIKILWDTFF